MIKKLIPLTSSDWKEIEKIADSAWLGYKLQINDSPKIIKYIRKLPNRDELVEKWKKSFLKMAQKHYVNNILPTYRGNPTAN